MSDLANLTAELNRVNQSRGIVESVLATTAREALYRLLYDLPHGRHRSELGRLVEMHWDSLPPLDRPYGTVAAFYSTGRG